MIRCGDIAILIFQAAILDLIESAIAPFDLPTRKTVA